MLVKPLYLWGVAGIYHIVCACDVRPTLVIRSSVIAEHKRREAERKQPRLAIVEDALRWSPLVSSAMLADAESRAEHEVSNVCL